MSAARAKAFSSEVDTGSREENASKQKTRASFRFHRNEALSTKRLRPCRQHHPSLMDQIVEPIGRRDQGLGLGRGLLAAGGFE
jgi:hypothetical protein